MENQPIFVSSVGTVSEFLGEVSDIEYRGIGVDDRNVMSELKKRNI